MKSKYSSGRSVLLSHSWGSKFNYSWFPAALTLSPWSEFWLSYCTTSGSGKIRSCDYMFETVDWSLSEVFVFDFYDSETFLAALWDAALTFAPVVSSVIEGFLSWVLGRFSTAIFKGFYRLFSDFDISILLIEDSMASSTIIEFVSPWSSIKLMATIGWFRLSTYPPLALILN